MTNDNDLDAQLPISKEALLHWLTTHKNQLIAIKRLTLASQVAATKHLYEVGQESLNEIDFAIEHVELLENNIKDDRCSNYPPVVRKG